jgi:hypothetical protein
LAVLQKSKIWEKKMIENDAMATVYLQGLAITCFNKELGRSESLLLRQANHNLSIKIIKQKNGDETVLADYKETDDELNRLGLEIEIFGSKNAKVDSFSKHQPNQFNRLDESLNDENHLDWIMDLEGKELHNTKLIPTGNSTILHNMPLTKLFIKNGYFYTERKTQYILEKVEKINGVEVDSSKFGRVGFIMACDIPADEVTLKISGKSDILLNTEPGAKYKIIIDNLRPGGDFDNDLPEYYKVLTDPANREFDFRKWTSSSGEQNCNEVILGKTGSINGFG